ncbi:PDZ domain-containing protein [Jhaorihella thermophila]
MHFDPRGDELLDRLGLEGVLVLDVVPGSPAEAAGLRPTRMTREGIVLGDIILALGDDAVRRSQDLVAALETRRAGETVDLTILRDGREITLQVALAAAP